MIKLDLPAVHIYGVAHGLEGIEADPHREDEFQGPGFDGEAKESEGGGEVGDEEIVVFEEAEEPQIDRNTGKQQ